MRPATYVSVLIRSHLRKLAPLPKDELLALKRSIGELASIGRNINQIAKAVNEGGRAPGSVREEFRAMLKICEALRDNTKALLKANVISWETGACPSGRLGFAEEPLFDLVSHGRGGPRDTGRHFTPAQIEQIRRTVQRAPEAVVKVLPRDSNDLRRWGGTWTTSADTENSNSKPMMVSA